MEELIDQLEEMARWNLAIATSLRTEDPEKSYLFFKQSELMSKAGQELKKRIPKETEIEGGGSTWWYVCPECHGTVDRKDNFCRHCGQAINN